MTTIFDTHAINHATVALAREMTPRGGSRHPETDTLFMGGPAPTDADQDALARFGMSKNYKVVFASFDPADPTGGPLNFHAIVTDGLTQSIALAGGRLWKRDRASPAVLLFPGVNGLLRINSKGRLVVREMKGPYFDHGYELARKALAARTARRPGHAPVVAPIGALTTVLDMKAFNATFAAGE